MGTRSDQERSRPGQIFGRLSDRSRQAREAVILSPTVALGRKGEDLAHRYLRSLGYEILLRRFRLPDGSAEIDIIARERDTFIFVEVKTRRNVEFGVPERAIDREKQRRIIRAAKFYAARAGFGWSQVRFDVVAIVMSEPPALTHFKDAFFHGRAF